MRELILLRHAHAEAATLGADDSERALSPIGKQEAQAAGEWLKSHALKPDRILCSPSKRTRETTDRVCSVLGDVELLISDDIYEASPGTLLDLIEDNSDANRLLVVGHNPGLEQLVALLNSGQSSDFRGMPPAAIAVLTVDKEKPFEPGSAELKAFWWP